MENLDKELGIEKLVTGKTRTFVAKSAMKKKKPKTAKPLLTLDFDIALSLEKAPPLELFDLLDDDVINKKHLERELKRFKPLDDELKKRYRDMGCKTLGMNHIKRDVIDMDEIHVDLTVQWARSISIDFAHCAIIESSLKIHGWIHDEQPIILYELSPQEIARLRAIDPNCKKKYGVITGHHRIHVFNKFEIQFILADVYGYENVEALKVWAFRLNRTKAPKLAITKEDVVKAWNKALDSGIYKKDEKSFDQFIDVYGFDTFDPKTLKNLKKRLLAKTSVKDASGGNVIVLDADTRKAPKSDPRSIYFTARKFDIPAPDEDPYGCLTKDARCDSLWRDHLDKVATNANNIIPVTLYADIAKMGGRSLNHVRRELEKTFNNKMAEIAEAIYLVNIKTYPDMYDTKNKKKDIEVIKNNLPWKFNGFMPQKKNDAGDYMETSIVDADGNEMKNAIYKKRPLG